MWVELIRRGEDLYRLRARDVFEVGLIDEDCATLALLALSVRHAPVQRLARSCWTTFAVRRRGPEGVCPVVWKPPAHRQEPRRPQTMARTKRVLVVDDDIHIRSAVAESLVQEGYAVETAANGLEALKIASRHSIDAIVLDLMMPVMDGWTFLARCKTQPWCRDVPVVAVSAGDALRSAGETLREFGVLVVLAKPFDLEPLIGTVQAFAPLGPR